MILLLKKLFARLFFPVPLTLLLLTAGMVLLFCKGKRCRVTAEFLLAGGLGLLLFGSLFGDTLLTSFSSRYPVLELEKLASQPYVISVFGHGFSGDYRLPITARFDQEMQLRLTEAARICRFLESRRIPWTLAVSVCNNHAPAEIKRETIRAHFERCGVTLKDFVLVEDAENTRQELLAFVRVPGRQLLVSEAFHIPRIMTLAQKYQVQATAAPAAWKPPKTKRRVLDWIPSADRLADFERLVYELLGILEYRII